MRSAHIDVRDLPTEPVGSRVLVVGDLMLDRAVEGSAGRISPEAPVPVLAVSRTIDRPGGAANVCAAVAAAGGRVQVIGCVGDDDAGRTVRRLLEEGGVACDGIVAIAGHPTTVKTRLLAGHHQIARFDVEKIGIPGSAADGIRQAVRAAAGDADAIILSDYAKGVCDPATCSAVIAAAAGRGIPVIVDPKAADFSRYRGATVITPNRSEAAAAAGLAIAGVDDAIRAAKEIASRHDCGAVLVTLGELGMVAVSPQGVESLPASVRQVFDVTGAGDTVVAVLAVALASGLDLFGACKLANAAAGIKVGRQGTATVGWQEIIASLGQRHRASLGQRHRPAHDKRQPLARALVEIVAQRRLGRTVGFTNGCFDILHHGHVALLEAAADECDILVVGLNSDASVERLKGWPRPYVTAAQRAAVLASLASVSYVIEFEEDTPAALIEAIAPDVLVKGGDYSPDRIVGAEGVVARGGRVVAPLFVDGASTTGLVDRIRGTAPAAGGSSATSSPSRKSPP